MTHTEQLEMWRACCHTCTLADAMKPCLSTDPDRSPCLFEKAETKPRIYLPPTAKVMVTMDEPATVTEAVREVYGEGPEEALDWLKAALQECAEWMDEIQTRESVRP